MTDQLTPAAVPSEAPKASDYFPWHSPELKADPYPFYARARTEAPVTRDVDGSYVLTKYADIMELGRLPTTIIEPEWVHAGAWAVLGDMALGRDEPDHTRLKRMTGKWLTPKMVKQWLTFTEEIADEVLDRIGDDGLVDGSDLAIEVTHRTICRVLQVPENDFAEVRREMRRSMAVLSAAADENDIAESHEAHKYLQGRTRELLEYKRENPGDGLFDALIALENDGQMSSEEMFATAVFFFTVGHMDASYLISAGLETFAKRPEVFAAFRADPSVREGILAEQSRIDAPEPVVTRYTTVDLDIRGVRIPANTSLRLLLGSANHDPDVFPNPDEFDYIRPSEQWRNLTFSFGSHTCQGKLLAQSEIRVVWERIAERFSRVEIAGEPELWTSDASRHYIKQPMRFIR